MSQKGSDVAATIAFVLFVALIVLLLLTRCTVAS